MAQRLHFEPVFANLIGEPCRRVSDPAAWTVVRLGDRRLGLIRPVGNLRVVFEADAEQAITGATLRNIADHVELLSDERAISFRNRAMKTYMCWIVTLMATGRRRRDPYPIGAVLSTSARNARSQARSKFTMRSNQYAFVRCESLVARRVDAEIALAAKSGVTLSFADAYKFITRKRKRFERRNSTKAHRAATFAPKMSASGNGML